MRSGRTLQFEPQQLSPKLFVIFGTRVEVFDLYGAQNLGRPSSTGIPHIPIEQKVVSRNHGSFLTGDGQTYYTDTASTNGTIYNGAMLPPATRQPLRDGDVLRIHGRDDPLNKLDVLMIYSTSYASEAVWNHMPLEGCTDQLTVGQEGVICLRHPAVSHIHASFYQANGAWAVCDHESRNGVLLNNRPLTQPSYLQPMDVVNIAGYFFVFTGSMLIYQSDPISNDASTASMDASSLYGELPRWS